jgi:hypothetical protein
MCPFNNKACMKDACTLFKENQCVILTISEALTYTNKILDYIEMNGR